MVQNSLSMSLTDDFGSDKMTVRSVLTPTTAKSIAQIFESDNCLETLHKIEGDDSVFLVPLPVPSRNPDPPAPVMARKSFVAKTAWQGGTTTVVSPTKPGSEPGFDLSPTGRRSSARIQQREKHLPPRKVYARKPAAATGRRRPQPAKEDSNPDPEESERVRIRRERNKAAAARCRKRRVDQINSLTAEVAELEAKKRQLEDMIVQLKDDRMQLRYAFTGHLEDGTCKLLAGTPPLEVKSEQPEVAVASFRPTSLEFEVSASVQGVAIDTPSSVLPCLNFDSFLSPTSSFACSAQQQNIFAASCDLNTPAGDGASLVSL